MKQIFTGLIAAKFRARREYAKSSIKDKDVNARGTTMTRLTSEELRGVVGGDDLPKGTW